jgi:hypothetical protein
MKYQVLAGCAQTRRLSLPLSPLPKVLEHYQFSHIILPQQNVWPFGWFCVLPEFPLLVVNGFLFGVVRFGVGQENPSPPSLPPEFLAQLSSQKSIRLISAALVPLIAIFVGFLVIAGKPTQTRSTRLVTSLRPRSCFSPSQYCSSQRKSHSLVP